MILCSTRVFKNIFASYVPCLRPTLKIPDPIKKIRHWAVTAVAISFHFFFHKKIDIRWYILQLSGYLFATNVNTTRFPCVILCSTRVFENIFASYVPFLRPTLKIPDPTKKIRHWAVTAVAISFHFFSQKNRHQMIHTATVRVSFCNKCKHNTFSMCDFMFYPGIRKYLCKLCPFSKANLKDTRPY